MSKEILAFYQGRGWNQEGIGIDQMLAATDEQLERSHTFIQWMFPLPEKSKAVPESPVLTAEDRGQFLYDVGLQDNMVKCTMRMLKFYGLNINGAEGIVKGANWEERSKEWIKPKNHNFLRLTRMIRSLKLCGMEHWAECLHDCLCKIYEEHKGVIGPLTKQFWDEAISDGETK